MTPHDRPLLARLVNDALNEQGLSARDVESRSRDADPDGRGLNHGTVSDIRVGNWGPKGPTRRTLNLLALTLNLDGRALLEAAGRTHPQPRTMPDDFLHLTPGQWSVLREAARQYRLANEGRRDHDLDSGPGSGVGAALADG